MSEIDLATQTLTRPWKTRSSLYSCRWSIAFLATTVFVVSGHLLIKAGLNAAVVGGGSGFASKLFFSLNQPVVLQGLAIYLLGSLCWMAALAQKDLSFLYPLSSLNYVLIAVAGPFLFHESVTARRVAGVVLITIGAFLMNWKTEAAKP